MFDNLGAGYGSVEVPLESESNRVHSIAIKCYPRLLHYLKSHRLTSNIPNTNRGMRTKLSMIDKFVNAIESQSLGGFRYEFTIYCTDKNLVQCFNLIKNYPTIDGVPQGIEVYNVTPQMYCYNVRQVLNEQRSIIARGTTNQAPTMITQKTALPGSKDCKHWGFTQRSSRNLVI